MAALGVLAEAPAAAQDRTLAETFSASGWVAAGAVAARGAAGWLEGSTGAVGFGGGGPGEEDVHAWARLHVEAAWEPDPRFGVALHATGRAEPESPGRALGVVEAFCRADLPWSGGGRLHLKAGHFFLPTTHEAVEVGWSSPYTLTTSAITSWIGEEVRPTGVLAEVVLPLGGAGDELRLGASGFGGNDTSGALLAWRGWALHDRLGVWGEWVPLPANPELGDYGTFSRQSGRGTRPFGDDLDGRAGWTAGVRWSRHGRAGASYTHYDNRGDRDLYGGEYAWLTRFDLLGGEWSTADGRWTLATEGLDGWTTMGFEERRVDVSFRAAYALVSWRPDPIRLTLRWDRFEVVDLDGMTYDDNDQDGHGLAVAGFWEPRPELRLGLEVLDVEATRPGAPGSADVGATTVRLEVRYYFGP